MTMKNSPFFKQVDLLVRVLPIVHQIEDFALKGGTAINFFLRDLPRISVDIDLAYLPIDERQSALSSITSNLLWLESQLKLTFPKISISQKLFGKTKYLIGLVISLNDAVVKTEVNTVIRGSIYGTAILPLSNKAQQLFELTFKMRCLSFADIYGGKICAALDRQHPREIFDITLLLKNEGLTDTIRKAFLFYLLSHPRPIVEILDPNFKNIDGIYSKEFLGMTNKNITIDELQKTLHELVHSIKSELTLDEKMFLLSFKKKKPDWDKITIPSLEEYPSIKWKLHNLNKMDSIKHKDAYEKLENLLFA